MRVLDNHNPPSASASSTARDEQRRTIDPAGHARAASQLPEGVRAARLQRRHIGEVPDAFPGRTRGTGK